ncbi:hypothetical protein FQR65_LT15181 [Abscondita terminalis]|nr:hypothetical protein FQR65_LT15181 [Abscondita terminalis]
MGLVDEIISLDELRAKTQSASQIALQQKPMLPQKQIGDLMASRMNSNNIETSLSKKEEELMDYIWQSGKPFLKDIIECYPDPKPAPQQLQRFAEAFTG